MSKPQEVGKTKEERKADVEAIRQGQDVTTSKGFSLAALSAPSAQQANKGNWQSSPANMSEREVFSCLDGLPVMLGDFPLDTLKAEEFRFVWSSKGQEFYSLIDKPPAMRGSVSHKQSIVLSDKDGVQHRFDLKYKVTVNLVPTVHFSGKMRPSKGFEG